MGRELRQQELEPMCSDGVAVAWWESALLAQARRSGTDLHLDPSMGACMTKGSSRPGCRMQHGLVQLRVLVCTIVARIMQVRCIVYM